MLGLVYKTHNIKDSETHRLYLFLYIAGISFHLMGHFQIDPSRRVSEDHMFDWRSCQICYPFETKLLLLLYSKETGNSQPSFWSIF